MNLLELENRKLQYGKEEAEKIVASFMKTAHSNGLAGSVSCSNNHVGLSIFSTSTDEKSDAAKSDTNYEESPKNNLTSA